MALLSDASHRRRPDHGRPAPAEEEEDDETAGLLGIASAPRPPPTGEEQLTRRSLLVGGLAGGVICVSNVYFGLKLGWGMGGALFSAIVGHSVISNLPRPYRDGFTIQENCSVQTCGNAAGGLSVGFVSAIPALAMLGREFSYASLTLWTLCSAYYGLFFAVPLRKEVVLRQKLPFPTGRATAEVITALHKKESDEPATGGGLPTKGRALFVAGCAAFAWCLLCFFVPGLFNVPVLAALSITAADEWLWSLYLSPAFLGASVLMGRRVCLSFLAGSVVAWAVVGPSVYAAGWVETKWGYDDPINEPSAQFWVLWVGVALMLADQVVSFLCMTDVMRRALSSWRRRQRAAEAFRDIDDVDADLHDDDLAAAAAGGEPEDPSPEAERVPDRWWQGGLAVSALGTVLVVSLGFGVAWWATIMAVVLAFPLARIAVQCVGETDISPVGALGKLSQLWFALFSTDVVINLMCANIAGSAGAQSGDLMQDLTTAHIVRASPRAQFLAQLVGSMVGVFANVFAYYVFSTVYEIPGDEFPAPAASAWYALALVIDVGLDALPAHALSAAAWALGLGAAFALARATVWREHADKFPSMLAFSIAFLVPPYYGVCIGLGSLVYGELASRHPAATAHLGQAVASGLMAGEGLMGITGAMLELAGAGYHSSFMCTGNNC